MNKKVRILSLDGGGMRGLVPAVVLEYVEKKLIEYSDNPNARIADYFDMIVGTSTGGILSCFYLTPNPSPGENKPSSKFTAAQAKEFYSEKGKDIFTHSKKSGWAGLRQLFNATQYRAQNIERIFEENFEELKMHDLLKKCIVTTYDMNSKKAFFFDSRESADRQREFYVRDVARSTSAAPTYFEPAVIKNLKTGKKMANIDGGVFANNPTMCAYAEARNTFFMEGLDCPAAKDMLILSIGTGGGNMDLPDVFKASGWGVINWAKSMPDIMMDGVLDTVDFQMNKIFGTLEEEHKGNYKRVNVPVEVRSSYSKDMADASDKNIQDLIKAGETALKEALKPSGKQPGLDDFIQKIVEEEKKRQGEG